MLGEEIVTMAMGPTDIIAIVSLSWKLYHDCLLVAYEAPDSFRQLVNELQSLQGTLRLLRANVEADNAFLDKASAERQATLQSGIEGCWETLKSLERLTVGFYNFRRSGSLQLIKRIKWAYHQSQIEGYRARIMAHTCTLSLTMSAMGNATLLNIQQRLDIALSPHRLQDLEREQITYEPETPSASDDDSSSSMPSPPGPSLPRGSIDTDATLFDPDKSRSPSFASSSKAGILGPISPAASDSGIRSTLAGGHRLGNDPSDLGQVVADANALLKCIPQELPESKRPTTPPLVDPPYPEYVVDQETAQRFRTAASSQNSRAVSVTDWLRCAGWWLLKSRTMFSAYERDFREGSPYSSLRGASITPAPINQERNEVSLLLALDNMRKVSWIVYEVVLKDEAIASSLTDHNLKLFLDLIHAIHHDFPTLLRAEALIAQPEDIRMPLHTTIWERSYVIDRKIANGVLLRQDCGDHSRWTAVEIKDTGACGAGEHMLFRTFVNAAIGENEYRVRSMGAPYLLVLWCRDGESDFKVTICSQQGVLHLSRDLTRECLSRTETRGVRLPLKPTLELLFPGPMPAAIEFLNEGDFEEFLRIPIQYFEAVTQEREENSDNERLLEPPIVLESMAHVTPTDTRVRVPTHMFCEVRILETSEGGWRRTRRLVFTSSPKEQPPQCKSYFLPLDRVYVMHETGSKKLILKYSDCNQSRLIKQPDKTHKWNREYDPNDPNICLSLSFLSPADAHDFKQKVLNYSLDPLWQSGDGERQVYSVFKVTGIGQKDYKCRALQTISTTGDGWTFASIFYVPKTIDFTLEPGRGLTAHFDPKSTFVTDYISNHTMQYCDMRAPLAAKFHHCEKRHLALDISFREFSVAQQLFQSLTSGWLLKYASNVIRVKYEPTTLQSRFNRKPRGPKAAANISVWQKDPGKKQLLVRWHGVNTGGDHWLSAALPASPTMNQPQKPGSEKAVVLSIDTARGTSINLGAMAAVEATNTGGGGKEKEGAEIEGLITIQFETCREKEKFAEASGLVCP